MEKVSSRVSNSSKYLLAAGLFVVSFAVMAQEGGATDLNEVGKNLIGLANTGKLLLLAFFYLGGLGLAGYGAWTVYKALKPNSQESFGLGTGMFVVGVVLCILPSMIGITATTFVGSDSTGTALSESKGTFAN